MTPTVSGRPALPPRDLPTQHTRQRIVIAPDSFKGSLSAREAAEALAEGWSSARPRDEVLVLPQADGGEGTLDAVEAAVSGARRHDAGLVEGPDGRPTQGAWLELPGRIAVVELAQMSGLPLMRAPDPLGASTRGLGEVIAVALAAGMQQLIVGLGGSASTDGGAGALAALGLRQHDGSELPRGGGGLATLSWLDGSRLQPAPPGGVILLSDVTAPLLGPRGAAAVFGPQKGATPEQLPELERGLATFAALFGGDPAAPGAGAAGGTGFGLTTAWSADIRSGADYIAELSGLSRAAGRADIVVTGEGRFDHTSSTGKVVGTVIRAGGSHRARIGVIAGQIADRPVDAAGSELYSLALTELAGSVDAALDDPVRWLRAAGSRAATDLSRRD